MTFAFHVPSFWTFRLVPSWRELISIEDTESSHETSKHKFEDHGECCYSDKAPALMFQLKVAVSTHRTHSHWHRTGSLRVAPTRGAVGNLWVLRWKAVANLSPTSSPLGEGEGLRGRDADGDGGPKQLVARSA